MKKFSVLSFALCFTAFAFAADAERGKTLVSEKGCVACHGLDGAGTTDLNPNIGGQHARYISEQLQAFKSGKRQCLG